MTRGYGYHKEVIYIRCQVEKIKEDTRFRIIDVNLRFEALTVEKLIGKFLRDALPDLYHAGLIKTCQDVIDYRQDQSLGKFITMKNKKYECDVLYVEEDIIVIFLNESKEDDLQYHNLQNMIMISEEFLRFGESDLDYQKIVDIFVSMCSAKYAVFNLFSDTGHNFRTVAFSGGGSALKKMATFLGFDLVGKVWDLDPVYMAKIEGRNVTKFETINDIIGDAIPKVATDMIRTFFNVGHVYVFIIQRNNRILGEFTVFLEKDVELLNKEMMELFTNQVGLLLTRYQSEKAQAKSMALIDTMINSIHEVIVVSDQHGYVTYTNSLVKSLMEEESISVIGSQVFDCMESFAIEPSTELYQDYESIYLHNQKPEVNPKTMEIVRRGQQMFWEYTITPLYEENLGDLGFLLLLRDKTLKHLEHEHVQYLSKHDQLTTLYNRRYFEEALLLYDYSDNLPISVIMGDVNGLKLINDSFGHNVGDELLVNTAGIIKKYSRPKDVVARIGGDEFIIIAPGTTEDEASAIVSSIKEEAAQVMIMGTNLSISLGFATKEDNKKSLSKVLLEAEEFMYKHKLFESASMHSKTLDMMVSSLFEKNQKEMYHSQRVSALSTKIAKEMGYKEETIQRIAIAGLMHDIGKIGVSEEILNKPARLDDDEYTNIKRHSEIGYRILSSVNEFSDISQFVLEHHERCDGKGYPKGLYDHEIHPISKIICVADAFDAMTNERTYGKVLSTEEALKELVDHAGTQFSPEVVKVVVEIYENEEVKKLGREE